MGIVVVEDRKRRVVSTSCGAHWDSPEAARLAMTDPDRALQLSSTVAGSDVERSRGSRAHQGEEWRSLLQRMAGWRARSF